MRTWQNQLSPKFKGRRDILYDSIEAPPTAKILTREDRVAALTAAYSDAPWADIDRLADEMTDDDLSVAEMIRYYLNGLAAAEDSWSTRTASTCSQLTRPSTPVTRWRCSSTAPSQRTQPRW